MALMSCPECGKEVSDKAVSCPNCGYPIRDQNADEGDREIQEQKKSDANKSSGHQPNKGDKSKKADKTNAKQMRTKVPENRSFCLTTKSGHSVAANACIVVGIICLILQWSALYGGGEWGHGDIINQLSSGNIGRGIGRFIGGGLWGIVALTMGLLIRKEKEGLILIIVSAVALLVTFFIF